MQALAGQVLVARAATLDDIVLLMAGEPEIDFLLGLVVIIPELDLVVAFVRDRARRIPQITGS